MDNSKNAADEFTRSEDMKLMVTLTQVTDQVDKTTQIAQQRAITPVWKQFLADGRPDHDTERWFPKIYDLLHSFDEVAEMLQYEVERKSWLNAYLLAAGLNQIAEDYLHADTILFEKAYKILQTMHSPIARLLMVSNKLFMRAVEQFDQHRPASQKVIRWQPKLAELVDKLAEQVTAGDGMFSTADSLLMADGNIIISNVPMLPSRLRNQVLKLPSCFLSFDQQLEDIQRITHEFSLHWKDPNRPLVVIGIRTSGSYLAPLYSAYLKSCGYHNVRTLTIRPGMTLAKAERLAIKRIIRTKSLALICDDPPISGATLVKAGQMLESAGVAATDIILLLQLFGDDTHLPAALQKYPAVLMPWGNWKIHQELEPQAVKTVLSETCRPPYVIVDVNKLKASAKKDNREHDSAVYRVTLVDTQTNTPITRTVLVRGIGLGYFGEHSIAISEKLAQYTAHLIISKPGRVYLEISPSEDIFKENSSGTEINSVEELVKYISDRNRLLPAKQDTSLRLFDRNAAWEVASSMLSKSFGRAWYLARMPLIDAYVKYVLQAKQPSIIDGGMTLSEWHAWNKDGTQLYKLSLAERDFSHLDLSCYDPAYDLASLADELEGAGNLSAIESRYENYTGDEISPERWLLYRMVHIWDMQRQNKLTGEPSKRKLARIAQEYFSRNYFEGIKASLSGSLCAVDLDGVLETNQLEFPSLTRSSAMSLRALIRHGYRVILATGRSLDEVKERCAAYHLSGGVAEYGAVLYDNANGTSTPLLNADEVEALNRLREKVTSNAGIYLNQDFDYAVRAYCLDKDGNPSGLTGEMIKNLISASGLSDRVYAIKGKTQTDFMATRINKATGIKEWIKHFDLAGGDQGNEASEDTPLAFAMGDSTADLPMLALAKHAFVAGHARMPDLPEGIQRTTRPFQRGLQRAVSNFVGHAPGNCPVCLNEEFTPETSYMLDILSAQENGTLGMLWAAIKLSQRKARDKHVSPQ